MFLHVFYSWLIAQVFHPLLFIALFFLSHGYVGHINAGDIFIFLVISTIVSSPCLLLGWLFPWNNRLFRLSWLCKILSLVRNFRGLSSLKFLVLHSDFLSEYFTWIFRVDDSRHLVDMGRLNSPAHAIPKTY